MVLLTDGLGKLVNSTLFDPLFELCRSVNCIYGDSVKSRRPVFQPITFNIPAMIGGFDIDLLPQITLSSKLDNSSSEGLCSKVHLEVQTSSHALAATKHSRFDMVG